jgi:hypothetical protein
MREIRAFHGICLGNGERGGSEKTGKIRRKKGIVPFVGGGKAGVCTLIARLAGNE